MAFSDASSVGGMMNVTTVSQNRYSIRITWDAVKKYRFLDITSEKFLNEQVRKVPRDLYFNQHELLEAYQSEKPLELFPLLEFYYSEYCVQFLVPQSQAPSLLTLLVLTIGSPGFGLQKLFLWEREHLEIGQQASLGVLAHWFFQNFAISNEGRNSQAPATQFISQR